MYKDRQMIFGKILHVSQNITIELNPFVLVIKIIREWEKMVWKS